MRRLLTLSSMLGAVLAATVALGIGQAATLDIVLFGVTGDGASGRPSLYSVDPDSADTNLVLELGNRGDGEEIAYSPKNGQLLHASGRVIGEDMILEWVDPATKAITPISVSGDECDEVSALTYAGDGFFLAGTIDQLLCSISPEGVVTRIATLEAADIATGLAFVGGTLYATEWGNQTNLLTLDASTGAVISKIPLQIDSPDYRLTALAAHPCSGELYAAMAIGPTEIRTPTTRSLVTIDKTTGHVEVLGDLGDSFAGLAFSGDDCEEEDVDQRPNISGIFAAGLHQAAEANLERAGVTSASAEVSPSTVDAATPRVIVSPPNTGDGGLLGD